MEITINCDRIVWVVAIASAPIIIPGLLLVLAGIAYHIWAFAKELWQ